MTDLNAWISSKKALTTLAVTGLALLGLLAACSSDNASPTDDPPVIITGGSGGNGSAGKGGSGDAGETSSEGGTSNQGGSGPKAGSGPVPEGGAAGDLGAGGEAGATDVPVLPSCPKTDVEFYNQPTTSQKSPFDNVKRLGAHATLPKLPGT